MAARASPTAAATLVLALALCVARANNAWIAREVQGEWRYAGQAGAALLPRSRQCALRITHSRVALWNGLATKPVWAARWRDLTIDAAKCVRSPTRATATLFVAPPDTKPFAPFFLLGRDNSRRRCGPAFDQPHPARYYFVKELKTYRDALEDASFLPARGAFASIDDAEIDARFMLVRQFVGAAGGDVADALVCVYRKKVQAGPSPSPSPSTPTQTTPKPKPTPKCFPRDAVVLARRGARRLRELELGERVMTGLHSWSVVYFFSHRSDQRYVQFVRFFTESNHSLTLSDGHYVRVGGVLRAARDVRIGDYVRVYVRDAGKMLASRVVHVQNVVDHGLYAPHTLHGDIVVNGVLVSSYTDAFSPVAAHAALALFRAVWKWRGVAVTMRADFLKGLYAFISLALSRSS